MDGGVYMRRSRFSSTERLLFIGLGLLAVFSPLYIDRRGVSEPEEEDEAALDSSFYLPVVLLLLLIIAIALSCCIVDTRFDPYWIHRVGGSSPGIIFLLIVLALVLKCKASTWNS